MASTALHACYMYIQVITFLFHLCCKHFLQLVIMDSFRPFLLSKGGGRDFIVGGKGPRMFESNHLLESNQYYNSITTKVGVSHKKCPPYQKK